MELNAENLGEIDKGLTGIQLVERNISRKMQWPGRRGQERGLRLWLSVGISRVRCWRKAVIGRTATFQDSPCIKAGRPCQDPAVFSAAGCQKVLRL